MSTSKWFGIGLLVAGMMAASIGCKEATKPPAGGPTPKATSTTITPAPTTPTSSTTGGAPVAAAKFVNSHCPIMTANAIDPAKVTDALTRDYKGQKVAFCCAMCPPAWDKLTDAEKDAKLKVVTAAP